MKFKALQRLDEPWLVAQSTYSHIAKTIQSSELAEVVEIPESNEVETFNGIAMVSLKGLMVKDPTPLEQVFLGATCTGNFTDQIESLIDNPVVQGVMIDLDSGGGSVQGVIEAADAVERLAKQKPVVAYTDGLIASAAYWVASQADDIISAPSGRIGSIGVYLPFADYSERYAKEGIKVDVIRNDEGKHKGAGIEGTKLTEDQRNQMQHEVQEIFEEFKSSVLRKRQVQGDAMQGQSFMAKGAVEAGLVDGIGNFQDAYDLLKRSIEKATGLTSNLL